MNQPRFLPPSRPLPDSLRASEPGTFAADTVIRRLPQIARRAITENDLGPQRTKQVEDLAAEIGAAALTPIDEPEAPDATAWRRYIEPHLANTWLDAPWFLVETYFFRRLLAATGYSQPGNRSGIDPFANQKRLALDGALGLAERLAGVDDTTTLLRASLWSNQIDLSLWPADTADSASLPDTAFSSNERLLVDDTAPASEMIAAASSVHLILDNAGSELVADLALTSSLLAAGKRVKLHAKPHPTYVSDVTPDDLARTLDRLDTVDPEITSRLRAGLRTDTLQVAIHPFWVSPLPFWRCPPDLVDDLATAELIIVKGDANYRRLLGDLHWDPTTAFADIVRPPRPLLALRTAKSELAAGLDDVTITAASATDPDWMTSGRWGMIQLAPAAGRRGEIAQPRAPGAEKTLDSLPDESYFRHS